MQVVNSCKQRYFQILFQSEIQNWNVNKSKQGVKNNALKM